MSEQSGEIAAVLLARIDRMKRLVVAGGVEATAGCLIVDAEAIMTSPLDPRWWVLEPEATGEWTHAPSGTTGPLGAALWGIACSYDPQQEVPDGR